MAKPKRPDPKVAALRREGSFNPHPESVADPLFASSDFFDGRDLLQVKYEMVRRVRADGQTISQAAAAFGFSRPSYYQAQAALEREGLPGLLPKKRGPRSAHKLSADVMGFLADLLAQESGLGSAELADRIGQEFGIPVHPRSIERALARPGKKTAMTGIAALARHGGDDPVAAYEELRSHALAGSGGGGQAGLIVLLRQGVAAWMTRRQASLRPAPAAAGKVAVPPAADEIHAALVRLLAGMALAGVKQEARA